MKLSLSVRIAEAITKDHLTLPLEDLARLAQSIGYRRVCMRASAGGVQTPRETLLSMARVIAELGMSVSMVTTDLDVPLNNEHGPDSLRDIEPHLDVAEIFSADLIRIAMKRTEDIHAAQRAADQARERGIRLAHQCHTASLFEEVDSMLEVIRSVGRDNFGVIYEPGNLLICGQPYGEETIRRLAPHVFNVYLQNHRVADDGPFKLSTRVRGEVSYHDFPLWEPGGIDFEAIFRSLKDVGYDGTVTVHQEFAKLMGAREAAEKSYEFLSPLIA